MRYASPSSLLAFCAAYRSKNKVTHLRSLLFRQQDGINSAFRKVYLAINAKLVPTE